MASQLEAEVRRRRADVAELADAYGLGPYALWLGGSSPSVRTILKRVLPRHSPFVGPSARCAPLR